MRKWFVELQLLEFGKQANKSDSATTGLVSKMYDMLDRTASGSLDLTSNKDQQVIGLTSDRSSSCL